MSTINKIKEIQATLPRILGNLPNVIGWSIGKKRTKGQLNRNIICITVEVSKKEDVDSKFAIPKYIEGIPTDVVVVGDMKFDTINSPYSRCTACFTNVDGESYGINACNDPSCATAPGVVLIADRQVCDTCDCLEQRMLDLSVTGENNGHVVVTGGKSSVYKINYNGSCSCYAGYLGGTGCNACTATLVAKDNDDGKLVMLTNHHCLNVPNGPFLNQSDLLPSAPTKVTGDIVTYNELSNSMKSIVDNGWTMPASLDANPGSDTEIIGKFKKAAWITKNSIGNNKVDAIAIELKLPDTNFNNYVIPLPGVNQLGNGPFPWITEAQLEEMFALPDPLYIYKSSRTSGAISPTQQAEITSIANVGVIGNSNPIQFHFIKALSDDNSIHFEGGDSGSPVLVEYDSQLYVLGIHFAGGADLDSCVSSVACPTCNGYTCSRKYGLFIPIWEVAEKLNVSAWEGEIVVNSNLLNITVNGLPYTRTTVTTQPITHKKD